MSFWDSPEGKQAVKRLDAWAACLRLEAAGGLALAKSKGDGAGYSSGGGMSADWLRAYDVELTLKEWDCRWTGMERLLRYIYVDGSVDELAYAEYELLGGETVRMSAQELAGKGEPGRFVTCERHYVTRRVYDLGEFEDPWVDFFMLDFLPRAMGATEERRRAFLEWQHVLFAQTMIRVRGLGSDPQMPRRRRSNAASAQKHFAPVYAAPTAAELAFARSVVDRAKEIEAEEEILRSQLPLEIDEYAQYMAGSVGVSATEEDSGNLRGAPQKVQQALAKGKAMREDLDSRR